MTTLPQCVGDWPRFASGSPELNLACAIIYQAVVEQDDTTDLNSVFSACGYNWLVGSLQYAYNQSTDRPDDRASVSA